MHIHPENATKHFNKRHCQSSDRGRIEIRPPLVTLLSQIRAEGKNWLLLTVYEV